MSAKDNQSEEQLMPELHLKNLLSPSAEHAALAAAFVRSDQSSRDKIVAILDDGESNRAFARGPFNDQSQR